MVNGVTLNGRVKTIDRATGQEVSPCLVTLSASREQFGKLRLSQVDPAACLKGLDALVSANPYDLEPIRPIIEFDLTKYRLMDSMDVVADLDSRPVLVKLTPTEFEHLIRQLFEAIGMEAWNTQASKDEGVDAVAVGKDPVFNGECIIQAKRYSKLVSAESVHALAGLVEHNRAAKGILVTTSWFGGASHKFAREHGRLQLIEGPELKYLIKEHLGKDVIPGPVPPPKRPSRCPRQDPGQEEVGFEIMLPTCAFGADGRHFPCRLRLSWPRSRGSAPRRVAAGRLVGFSRPAPRRAYRPCRGCPSDRPFRRPACTEKG
ncbi:restriction endonuclease [Streptomyces sp. NPDC001307]|uniref:restriction endonuclease n=1 Tax=Streptomyces sp. NPDC001307 TaxID=3364560 RepID=UPI00367679E7